MEATAKERRNESDAKEYALMMSKVKEGDFTLDEYLVMVTRLRNPFRTVIDDPVVTVSQDNCAIMMRTSALEAISKSVLVKKREADVDVVNNPPTKQQRSGRAACDTTFGANGIQAQHGSQRREDNQNEKLALKQKNALIRELANIKEALTLLERRKEKINRQNERRNQTVALRVAPQKNYEKDMRAAHESRTLIEEAVTPVLPSVGIHAPREQTVIPVLSTVQNYWEVTKLSDQPDLIMMLRLFAPACGKLSKSKADQFAYILDKNQNLQSQARVDSKVEEINQRVPETESILLEMKDDNEPECDDEAQAMIDE
jgi:hypothetical protein